MQDDKVKCFDGKRNTRTEGSSQRCRDTGVAFGVGEKRDVCENLLSRSPAKRAYFSRWLLRYGSKKSATGFVAVDLPAETPSSGKQAGLFAAYRGIKFYQKVDASS